MEEPPLLLGEIWALQGSITPLQEAWSLPHHVCLTPPGTELLSRERWTLGVLPPGQE